MKKLTITDLIEGNFYATTKKNSGYIFCSKGDNVNAPFLKYPTYSHGHLSSIGNGAFSTYRDAIEEEAEWLKACIKAKMYVEKPIIQIPTLQNNYSIF